MGINSVYNSSNYPVYPAQDIKDQAIDSNVQNTKTQDSSTCKDIGKHDKPVLCNESANNISTIKREQINKQAAFRKMVETLFVGQGIKYNLSLGIRKNLENLIYSDGISEQKRLDAEQAIGENGEWGVEQTADRILNFARALSNGDSSKISVLRDAVEKGFAQARRAWGGKLPDICSKTYERIMQGFDEWEQEIQEN